ncbi:hypothetical protein [Aeromicrobium sp. CTD01-1L150]|uniref:hypothetical protein n=1 Tax=Aeromicrobium sp. CTD01-1L150 TaxID=3341830 RepID=UPI0035C0D86D
MPTGASRSLAARARALTILAVIIFVSVFMVRIVSGWIADATGHHLAIDEVPGIGLVGAALFAFVVLSAALWIGASAVSMARRD